MINRATHHEPQNVVTIGGGTGMFPVVTALRNLNVEVTCIVAMSDSGGSSGRIRDEFGFQPVGDVRQALAALTRLPAQDWIQRLLLYRFEKGSGLRGHNLGNLLLTALQDMSSSTTEALHIAKIVFSLDGKVLPVTDQTISLKTVYQDGTSIIGEHLLDEATAPSKRIDHIELIPPARCTKQVLAALRTADQIIICPGDLFASIAAVLMVEGIKEALSKSRAQLTYMMNLMTRNSQTANLTAQDHLHQIESMIQKSVDRVILNADPVPHAARQHYDTAGEMQVIDDFGHDPRIIRASLLGVVPVLQKEADTVPRSLLRHDPRLLQPVLQRLLSQP